MRPEDKERVCHAVINRVIENRKKEAENGGTPLETVINDTVCHERNRLKKEPNTREHRKCMKHWKKINKCLLNATEKEHEKILTEIVERFTNEIVGHFNEQVYQFTTRAIPLGLGVLLNTISPRVLLSNFPHLPNIRESMTICGEIEHLLKLEKQGTIILVPTHSSNMDSIIIGWALYQIGLRPFTYGAGINLFTNWIISYFMHNLGAYKVDRKKKASIYKETLKEYATVSIEEGYNNLFFPGGTRSRSGGIQQHLKLGLLGSGIQAYINNLKTNKEKPNIYVVPCTLSYELVLEAENLSQDFFKETGKSRYIITDDEFSQPRRILNFISSFLSLNSRIYVNICPPLDLFGNRVNKEGVSCDNRGRPIDITRYVLVNGKVDHLIQRDREYTKHLATKIVDLYKINNVALSTNILAFTVYKMLERDNPDMDFYRLLRTGGNTDWYPVAEVLGNLSKVMTQLKELQNQNKICIDERLINLSEQKIMEQGLQCFNVYHTKPVLIIKDDRISPNDCNLLFYYHNRIQNYGLTIS